MALPVAERNLGQTLTREMIAPEATKGEWNAFVELVWAKWAADAEAHARLLWDTYSIEPNSLQAIGYHP